MSTRREKWLVRIGVVVVGVVYGLITGWRG